ncbi:hypothetical protein [Acidaminococcus intestini]|nr:hypothetical protein [Acidaminococcus intestini]
MNRLLKAISDYLYEHQEEYRAWLKERERQSTQKETCRKVG